MNGECDHDEPILDPLPDALVYLLATPEGALSRSRSALARAVCAQPRLIAPSGRFSAGLVCRFLREHTDWGRRVQRSMVCAEAREVYEASRTGDVHPLNDDGMAHRVVDRHGADVAWVERLSAWRVWDGNRWRDDPGGIEVARRVAAYVRGPLVTHELARAHDAARTAATAVSKLSADDPMLAEATNAAAAAARRAKKLSSWVESRGNHTSIQHTVAQMRTVPGVSVDEDAWDADPKVLGTADGIVELDTEHGARPPRPPRRLDRITRLTRAAAQPWADGPSTDTAWGRFLRSALPDSEVRAYVQRLAGASLLGDNRERLLVIITGPSSTGKSTLIEALVHALGDLGGPFDLSLLTVKPEEGPRADLVDALPARLLGTTEASAQRRLRADAVKRVTGGDKLAARTLYAREMIKRRPAFTLWLATNAAPSIVGADKALWRRLAVVPMTAAPAVEDTSLGDRLRARPEDVLAWCLDGFTDYALHGLGTPPAACRAADAQVRADLDLVDAWLSDEVETAKDAITAAGALADAWQTWCDRMRIADAERLSDVALARALTGRGFDVVWSGPREARVRARKGLRLRTADDRPLRAVGE